MKNSPQGQRPLQVCLDARFGGDRSGTRQVVVGMAHALSELRDGDEGYCFLTSSDAVEQLEPHVRGNCRMLTAEPPAQAQWRPWWKRAAGAVPGVRRIRQSFRRGMQCDPVVPISDGTIERNAVEVMHFTMQGGFRTDVPSIYEPWDLQHVRYPNFFSIEEVRWRELTYRTYCEQAATVAVRTIWGKQDLMEHYGISSDKICVVPVGPLLGVLPPAGADDVENTRRKLALPDQFIFFPATTFVHKNHLGLLRALAMVRDRTGLRIPLVCCGQHNSHFATIQAEAAKLKVEHQVRFLDFVSTVELQSLYQLARCMVFPTKYEGWGLPLVEALWTGLPLACSRIRPVSDVVGDAAILFDPDNVDEMAEAAIKVWSCEELRSSLIERGGKRAALFSWEKTARMFRAHYRRIGGRRLEPEDEQLLAETPQV